MVSAALILRSVTFFVSRCNKRDGIDEMCAFLKSNTIVPRDVVQMNNSEAKFNSYKVSVSVVDASKMMNSGMWVYWYMC